MSVIVTVVFLVFCVWTTAINYKDPHWETIVVTDKSILPGQKEVWLVYTEDEVYCITDLIWVGFVNSSDVYNSIKVGEHYVVHVSGIRFPLLSKYKIIREAVYDATRETGD